MPPDAEKCTSCGRVIATSESAYLWREQVVCEECHAWLSNPPQQTPDAPESPRPAATQKPQTASVSAQMREAIASVEAGGGSRVRPCPDCGGQVSTAAETCPHCGRPMRQVVRTVERTAKRWKAAQLVGMGLMVLGIAIGCGGGGMEALIIVGGSGAAVAVVAAIGAWWHHG